jgi:hypothetical protein
MTNHVVRLYALAASLLVLFLTWAAIASHPWSSGSRGATRDPRVVAIRVREQHLRQEAIVVRRVVAGRWHQYRVALAARQRQIATAQRRQRQAAASLATSSAPSVQVVTLPPLTVTRTS